MSLSRLLAATLIVLPLAAGAQDDRFFRRFSSPDPAALAIEIEAARAALARQDSPGQAQERYAATADLARLLTIARREGEAYELLEPVVEQAQVDASPVDLGWLRLELATTSQYLHKDSDVLSNFSEALRLARLSRALDLEHYALHHRARYLAEKGAHDLAKVDFESALAIRRSLGNAAAVDSTLAALAELQAMAPE